MGHQRLGEIQKSQKWSLVVAALGNAAAGGATATNALASLTLARHGRRAQPQLGHPVEGRVQLCNSCKLDRLGRIYLSLSETCTSAGGGE